MLFCRSGSVAVLLSLIGYVCGATTPVPEDSRGHWLRGRTQGENRTSETVQPYPESIGVQRSMTGDGVPDDGTQIDDVLMVTNTEELFPPDERHTKTSEVPSSSISNDDLEKNATGSNDGENKIDDPATPEAERETTRIYFRTTSTGDEFRTRRGTVLVDDDFNISPEPDTSKLPKTSTTDEGSGQEPSSTADLTSPDLEGSGDVETTGEAWHSCLNATCDSRDLSVFPGHDEIVPVGTNLSLLCIQSNESLAALRWYKYDDAGNVLLQADIDRELELTIAITKSKTEDSGRYACVRTTPKGSCCHRTLHVKVYEVPNYRYHLIVVGVVAAVSLFACLLIGVCRNYKTKKYEVQMELQNMESECVYKM